MHLRSASLKAALLSDRQKLKVSKLRPSSQHNYSLQGRNQEFIFGCFIPSVSFLTFSLPSLLPCPFPQWRRQHSKGARSFRGQKILQLGHPDAVMGKITCQVISNQNQNHLIHE